MRAPEDVARGQRLVPGRTPLLPSRSVRVRLVLAQCAGSRFRPGRHEQDAQSGEGNLVVGKPVKGIGGKRNREEEDRGETVLCTKIE